MKTAKLTLQQKLAKRPAKIPNRFTWKFLTKCVMNPILSKRYNPNIIVKDDINKCEGPAFLVFNHQARCDYIWLSLACYPRPINYMTNYDEFFRSHLHFILRFINAIPKKMFNQDISSMRKVQSIINQGGVIAFAPDGTSSIVGHNQPIVPGTGKYLKYYGIPVYLGKIAGGFLTNHKCCLDDRKGRVDCTLSILFTKDQLKEMSEDQIEEELTKALWLDDYEWQKQEHIKWETNNRICTRMHDLLYKCPKCGKDLVMNSHDHTIECKNCGNGANMNDYYEFEPFNENCCIPESPSKWTDWERGELIREIQDDENYSLKFHCKVGALPKYKYVKHKATTEIMGEGDFTIDHKGLHFVGIKEGKEFKFDLPYSTVYTISINVDCQFFALYINGEYHDFYPDIEVTGKVLLLTEEMHRLHVNKWKNFPWMEHLYKEDVEESYFRYFRKKKPF